MIWRKKRIHKQGGSYIVCLPIEWVKAKEYIDMENRFVDLAFDTNDNIVIRGKVNDTAPIQNNTSAR